MGRRGAERQPAIPTPVGPSAILLFEDGPAVRELAPEILAEAGFDVLAAGSGYEALEARLTSVYSGCKPTEAPWQGGPARQTKQGGGE